MILSKFQKKKMQEILGRRGARAGGAPLRSATGIISYMFLIEASLRVKNLIFYAVIYLVHYLELHFYACEFQLDLLSVRMCCNRFSLEINDYK